MISSALVTAVAAVTVASAAMPAQFDLVCVGTATTDGKGARAFSEEYSVDLEKQLYCAPGCRNAEPIGSITDRIIVFWQNNITDDQLPNILAVDRETGRMSWHFKIAGGPRVDKISRCEPAPFKPFPELHQKF